MVDNNNYLSTMQPVVSPSDSTTVVPVSSPSNPSSSPPSELGTSLTQPTVLQKRVKRFTGFFLVTSVLHTIANFNLLSVLWIIFLFMAYKVSIYSLGTNENVKERKVSFFGSLDSSTE